MLYWALRVAFAISRHTPLTWRYRLVQRGCEAVYLAWPAKRRATRRTMAVVTGDRPDGRRADAAARASWRNYGGYIVDFFNLPNVSPQELTRRTHVQGWEHLDRAVEAGKGVVFVSGHLGRWDYAPVVIAARHPGRMNLVVEPFTSPKVDAMIQGQRAAQGSGIIPMTEVRRMVRTLRGGGILAILVDRPASDGDGVPVEFFGRPTTVPGGAATLAALTGAALLPGFFLQRADGSFDGRILPPIEPPRSGDRNADVRWMTQQALDTLEGAIRRAPEHWYMFRDMWAGSPTPLSGQTPAPERVTREREGQRAEGVKAAR